MCAAVLHGAQAGIFQVAIVWGIRIALAIHMTSSLSGAHLNPAVTLAATLFTDFKPGRALPYVASQMAGAFIAAAVLYVIFGGSLAQFEKKHGIVRGQPGSEASAMVFGEFYPNPGGEPLTSEKAATVPMWRAFAIEVIGTGILVTMILGLTDRRNAGQPPGYAPVLIGLTVTLLISLLGPLTMACFNPVPGTWDRGFSPASQGGAWCRLRQTRGDG